MSDLVFLLLIAFAAAPLYGVFVDAFDEYEGDGWKDVARALPVLAAHYCFLGAVGGLLFWRQTND
jgi:hypothetical protein